MVALTCWAVIVSVGFVALVVRVSQDSKALDHTATALHQSSRALARDRQATGSAAAAASLATSTFATLRAEATGLCVAIAATAGYVDEGHRVLHALLRAQGYLELRAGEQLQHASGRAVRRASRIQQRLGHQTLTAARHILYLAPVDCQALTSNPLGYTEPAPVPFGSPRAPR